ncbi:hypothetical protein BKA64DRAFT_553531, partial [Cadophora sp. MPI-SDFR-AT-0126]
KVSVFEGLQSSKYVSAIKAYLLFAKCPSNEYEAEKHHAHIEPFQSHELQQTSFHIIIDIEKDMVENGEFQSRHARRLIRINSPSIHTILFKRFQNPLEAAIFLLKVLRFTDTYSWAK